jgi:signal transduction histidine kinase/ActR/RegA family two-component response regulator
MRLPWQPRGRLFHKYFVYFVVLVSSALLASGASGLYFTYKETRAALSSLQQEKALGAAVLIERFIREIENQIRWANPPQMRGATADQRYLDLLRLLRQVPAITEASWLDANGREQLRVSRLSMDRIGSGVDLSSEPAFREPTPERAYVGPVYFHKETEPYLKIAATPDRKNSGVTVVDVNLKFVWDVISLIRVGATGYAYVVDGYGNLISHPDISRVLQKSDFSSFPQVRAAFAHGASPGAGPQDLGSGSDPQGNAVLAAYAPIAALGWMVFVEQPLTEAYAPLYAAMVRNGVLLVIGLALAVLASLALARRMVTPIRALQQGAARIGAGALDQTMDVKTGDELEALAAEFNRMAARLRESYAGLERKVAERTHELELANQAKSRFLRAASHDLRQPMHALGLFVAQLNERVRDPQTRKIAAQAAAAVTALQELLDAILDISRLDAGVIAPIVSDLAVNSLLDHLDTGFAPDAAAKGLRLRAVPSRLVVRSDPVLLERILLNLVANAVRYTERGGIAIGCRRRGNHVRIEVWDTGVGIAPGQQQAIFQEFYQVDNPERDRHKGLGLGLAIAARLARLLGCRIELSSRPGKGSVFAIEVPRAKALTAPSAAEFSGVTTDRLRGALVLIVDDDALVREAMQGLFAQWGCEVAVAANGDEAMAALARHDRLPDALLCDYLLPGGESGADVIRRLHAAAGIAIPAALISGDTAPETLQDIKASGYPLLPKPVAPAKLRALTEHLLAASRPGSDRPADCVQALVG